MSRRFIALTVCTALSALVAASACAADGHRGDGSGPDGNGREHARRTLTVYAAASLTSTFEQIGKRFEREHHGVEVTFGFAGSSDLVAQIQHGAPADVFASADEANMAKFTANGLNGSDPKIFATNTLRIAVPPGNPSDVGSLRDLADPELDLVICAPEVPCGAAARSVARQAELRLRPVSEEQSVTGVLGKVTSAEADAGLVYVTDVIAAGDDVQGIDFPEAESVVNRYPIATVTESEDEQLAREFVESVLDVESRQILTDAGFGPAPAESR